MRKLSGVLCFCILTLSIAGTNVFPAYATEESILTTEESILTTEESASVGDEVSEGLTESVVEGSLVQTEPEITLPAEDAPAEENLETVEPSEETLIPDDTGDAVEPTEGLPVPTDVPEVVVTEMPSTTTSTEFVASVEATVVCVTIPLTVDVYIDPNAENGFVFGAIEVQNHTKAPVVVSIKDFNTTGIPFQNCIRPEELPDGLYWDNLSVSETLRYVAIGIRPIEYKNVFWREDRSKGYVYTSPTFKKTELGVIDGQSTAYLGLQVYYGKAFATEQNFSFAATFVVELLE